MIKIDADSKGRFPDVWIFSDPHFNHTNICRGITKWRMPDGSIPITQTRDFENLDKMNAAIVNNINEVVMQDDILICLGDWSFGGFESIKEFWDRIVCKNIHLVLGNHDHHIERNRGGVQGLFKSVSHYDTLEIGQHKFRLMHYPISSWDGLNKGVMHLHGHCHLPNHKKFSNGRRMDVGMDGNPDFAPYDLKRLLNDMKKRPIGSEMGTDDHHLDDMQNVDR